MQVDRPIPPLPQRGQDGPPAQQTEERVREWKVRLTRYNSPPMTPATRRNVRHDLGPCAHPCSFCGALHWIDERTSNSSKANPRFTVCCSNGAVRLPPIGVVPSSDVLEILLTVDNPVGHHFRTNITRYNNALAFTSITINRDASVTGQRGQMVIRASGRIYHFREAFTLDAAGQRNFAQIYLLDRDDAVEERLLRQAIVQSRAIPGLDRGIMTALTDRMNRHNAYAQIYRTAHERFNELPDATAVRIRQVQGGSDPRVYNLPSPDNTNIAAIVIEGSASSDDGRDIWVQRRDRRLKQVSELSRTYVPMHYPLLHINGEDGWHTGIPLSDAEWDPERYPLWVPRIRGEDGLPIRDGDAEFDD